LEGADEVEGADDTDGDRDNDGVDEVKHPTYVDSSLSKLPPPL
jgi:hypothetical protein